MHSETVTVTGASSQLGFYLLPLLRGAGYDVVAITRKASFAETAPEGVGCQINDLSNHDQSLKFSRYLVHLAPIWTLPPLIARAVNDGLTRLIAFSSTSAMSKSNSTDLQERQLALRLQEGERAVAELCNQHHVQWTIFRPTMIYGSGRDANVSVIARFISRFGFFPLAAPALGLRQPVHAEDLAQAVLSALLHPPTYSQTYNLSGAEVLTYRALTEKIFTALDKKPHLLFLPPVVFQTALHLAKLLPRYRHVSTAAIVRMNQDLAFSHEEASRDFGFTARRFEFEPLPDAKTK